MWYQRDNIVVSVYIRPVPSYSEHRSNALPLAILMGVIVLIYSKSEGYTTGMSIGFAACGAFFVIVGVALPDVDHHNSIPRRKLGALGAFVTIILYIMGVGFVTRIFSQYFSSPFIGFAVFFIIFLVGFPVIGFILQVVGDLFDGLTTHRGITHSVIFILAAGVLIFYLPNVIPNIESTLPQVVENPVGVIRSNSELRFILAVSISLGIFKHLQDDGVDV